MFTVGSVCSGIEAASVAWNPLGFDFCWFSEIAPFPSRLLHEKYPDILNVGDMNTLPSALLSGSVEAPDLICGGTPCQAFSLAGHKDGLNDDRGNLTLKFVNIVDANDNVRLKEGKRRSVVFWENVEGVLKDKTNAFGCLISSLAGFDNVLDIAKWPNAGVLKGPKRNVAWRVLDAKYFGLPQQRKRLYLLAGDTEFKPENVLFEIHKKHFSRFPESDLTFEKNGHSFEIFREYTDCLYSSYGTKWNGNAAAYNGSLFVVQDQRLRRLSPLECERLMGFPDNYTNISGSTKTNRYQAIGNSWAVPVIRWIGKRLINPDLNAIDIDSYSGILGERKETFSGKGAFYDLGKKVIFSQDGTALNCSTIPESCVFKTLPEIISEDAPESIYISPVGCDGILRRKKERNLKINHELENVLKRISLKMSQEEIEKKSRVQKRGKYSYNNSISASA